MRLSRERLQREAAATGFRVEILEKVAQLLELLAGLNRHPYLKGRLALKGGTALNLFIFDAPRLSIDIDLNYTNLEWLRGRMPAWLPRPPAGGGVLDSLLFWRGLAAPSQLHLAAAGAFALAMLALAGGFLRGQRRRTGNARLPLNPRLPGTAGGLVVLAPRGGK